MISAVKNHWITGLAVLCAGFALLAGTAMAVTGGEFDETEVRIYGLVVGLGGVSILSGLWVIKTDRLTTTYANALIIVGLVAFGGGMWWFVLIPPAIALAVLYAGVFRHGLKRELLLS